MDLAKLSASAKERLGAHTAPLDPALSLTAALAALNAAESADEFYALAAYARPSPRLPNFAIPKILN